MTGVDKLEEGTKVNAQIPGANPPVSPPVKSPAKKGGKA
jgi:hypothetical protein